jgi:plastocyanin
MRGTGNRLRLAAMALVVSSIVPGVALAASTITGTVTFDGKAPALRPLAMDADPVCAKKHPTPAPNEMLVLGNNNTMGNILVWVSKGVPAGKTFPVPKTPVVLDQNGCQYKPHVMGIMVGQQYKILNSDGVLHNIHTLPKINPSFNQGMPAKIKEATTVFNKPEDVVHIKCDVHPWMSAFMAVFTHPFFAVTNEKGQVSIPTKGLADGTYTIEIWQEKLAPEPITHEVTVKDGKATVEEIKIPAKAAARGNDVNGDVKLASAKTGEAKSCCTPKSKAQAIASAAAAGK